MVAVAVLAVALAIGMPSFADWISNMRIRSTAESLQNGLQFARSEAVRRNNPTQFQLVTTATNSCALSTAGPYWVVNLPTTAASTPAGACGAAVSDATAPYILQVSPVVSTKALTSVTLAASQSVISFDGLGRQTASANPATAALALSIEVKSSNASSCLQTGGTGTLRCLRVTVSTSGQIRMCDPYAATGLSTAC